WHTRFSRDWSSDVCSSDLFPDIEVMALHEAPAVDQLVADHTVGEQGSAVFSAVQQPTGIDDPEEQLHIAKALFSELLPELVYDATQEQPLAREFVERVEGVFGHVGVRMVRQMA